MIVRKRKGFTLLELIVVIAILAILLSIAIPAYSGYRERAELQAQEANIRMLENAAMLYFSDGHKNIDWPKDPSYSEYIKDWPKGYSVSGQSGNFTVTPPSIP